MNNDRLPARSQIEKVADVADEKHYFAWPNLRTNYC